MQEHPTGEGRSKRKLDAANSDTRRQEAGEAETTRFGMEDGDNTDVPATGGATTDESDEDSR